MNCGLKNGRRDGRRGREGEQGEGRMWPRRKVGKVKREGGVGGVSWCHRAEVVVVVVGGREWMGGVESKDFLSNWQ